MYRYIIYVYIVYIVAADLEIYEHSGIKRAFENETGVKSTNLSRFEKLMLAVCIPYNEPERGDNSTFRHTRGLARVVSITQGISARTSLPG